MGKGNNLKDNLLFKLIQLLNLIEQNQSKVFHIIIIANASSIESRPKRRFHCSFRVFTVRKRELTMKNTSKLTKS